MTGRLTDLTTQIRRCRSIHQRADALDYEPAAFIDDRIALRRRLLDGEASNDDDLLVPREELP